jgi:hypothetical protein
MRKGGSGRLLIVGQPSRTAFTAWSKKSGGFHGKIGLKKGIPPSKPDFS